MQEQPSNGWTELRGPVFERQQDRPERIGQDQTFDVEHACRQLSPSLCATSHAPISRSVSIQTTRNGSSGFSATLTRARTIPSVRGTLRSDILVERSPVWSPEGLRLCPEAEAVRDCPARREDGRGSSLAAGDRHITARRRRSACSRSCMLLMSRVKELDSAKPLTGRSSLGLPHDKPFYSRVHHLAPRLPVDDVAKHTVRRRSCTGRRPIRETGQHTTVRLTPFSELGCYKHTCGSSRPCPAASAAHHSSSAAPQAA